MSYELKIGPEETEKAVEAVMNLINYISFYRNSVGISISEEDGKEKLLSLVEEVKKIHGSLPDNWQEKHAKAIFEAQQLLALLASNDEN